MSQQVRNIGPQPHQTLSGELAPGTALGLAASKKAIIRIHGAAKLRIRVKTTLTTSALTVKYLRPDGVTPYTAGQPAAAAALAVGETSTDLTPGGEGYAEITVAQTGATPGTLDFVDVSEL